MIHIILFFLALVAPPTAEEDLFGCYTSGHAYISGTMNIRNWPSVEGVIIGTARPGYAYRVQDSFQGETYCWLLVDTGWIADTQLVGPEITYSGFPQIIGDDDILNQAISWLRWHSHEWFDYVVDTEQALINEKPAGLITSSKRAAYAAVKLNRTYFWGWPEDVGRIWMASVLVHEACHHRQWDRGNWHSLTESEQELECYTIQGDMLEDFVSADSTEMRKIALAIAMNSH